MRSVFLILNIFIIIFTFSCKKESNDLHNTIILSSAQVYNYIYDDFKPSFSIKNFTRKAYALKFVLSNENGQKLYESAIFDTTSLNHLIDSCQSFFDIL